MRAPLEAALEAVALRLTGAGVPFLLGGSALLDALGLDICVRDIDLMLRPEDRERFVRACAEWLLAVDGVEVEGLGGLGVVGGPRTPFRSSGSRRYGAVDVPLCDPAVWLELYRVYKPDRARLLERLVNGAG